MAGMVLLWQGGPSAHLQFVHEKRKYLLPGGQRAAAREAPLPPSPWTVPLPFLPYCPEDQRRRSYEFTTLKLVYSSCGYVLFIDCAQGEYTLTDTTHYNVIPEVYGGKTQVLLGDTIYPATEYLVFHSNRLKDMDAFYRAHNDPATPAPNITYTENSLSLYQNAPSPYPDVSSELAPHVAQLKDLGVISECQTVSFIPRSPLPAGSWQ